MDIIKLVKETISALYAIDMIQQIENKEIEKRWQEYQQSITDHYKIFNLAGEEITSKEKREMIKNKRSMVDSFPFEGYLSVSFGKGVINFSGWQFCETKKPIKYDIVIKV
ncbi:MAG: hypothetical protein R8P61_32685 [Bacteroidia bacterium]|nr:hypothetical protein [Bacteroidia bacterium]